MKLPKTIKEAIKTTSCLIVCSINITFFIGFLLSSCSSSYSGRIVDAETNQPIEGAIVLIQWTRRTGIGDYHTDLVNIIERSTNAKGEFVLPSVSLFSPNPFSIMDPPDIVIFKKGYVAWRNDAIFPTYEKRNSRSLPKEIKLEHFKDSYSINDHLMFMDSGIIFADFNRTPLYSDAQRNESIRGQPEVERKRNNMEEQAFIKCLQSLEVGKHRILDICPTAWWINYDSRKRLLSESSDSNSKLYNAMKELRISVEIEEQGSSKNYFLIKK